MNGNNEMCWLAGQQLREHSTPKRKKKSITSNRQPPVATGRVLLFARKSVDPSSSIATKTISGPFPNPNGASVRMMVVAIVSLKKAFAFAWLTNRRKRKDICVTSLDVACSVAKIANRLPCKGVAWSEGSHLTFRVGAAKGQKVHRGSGWYRDLFFHRDRKSIK